MTVVLLCHECGKPLTPVEGRKLLRCDRCKAWRHEPTHPALRIALS